MPENALLWCWSLSGKLPAFRRDSATRSASFDCGTSPTTLPKPVPSVKEICAQSIENSPVSLRVESSPTESIYSKVSKPRRKGKELLGGPETPKKKTVPGEAVYESILTLDPFEMISMAHMNQLQQTNQLNSHVFSNGNTMSNGSAITNIQGPTMHIVANPMEQDSLYTTIGDVSERVYECPDDCAPPVPPKQMEVLYTKPTKVFPKTNGAAALKIYKTRENVPMSPTRESTCNSSSSDNRELQQENYALKQEILAYWERVKALAMKLEQFNGISSMVEELQRKVDKVSQENARLRCFEREHREAQEQLKEAQKQYKLDMDQLGQQVNLLYTERNDLGNSLAKLQAEHDCLLVSSQNSVSFHYHSQAMLEVKRLLEELKNKYHNDKESLLLRVENTEHERDDFKSKISQLQEELEALRSEKDSLTTMYQKAVRQNQSLVTHIKELQTEDSEMHSLMQTLLQSAHQAVAERDTLERLVKPRDAAKCGAQTTVVPLSPQESHSIQPGTSDWISDQSFLSC